MKAEFSPTVYLLSSARNGTLYTGVTSNIMQRIGQHREGTFDGFTKRYSIKTLVWFEQHSTMEYAIQREKRVKKWRRTWKLKLIEEQNPTWRDLAENFGYEPLRHLDSRLRGNDEI